MNRFRCQYQKGNTCVSETFESEYSISSAQILYSLAKLAISVGKEVGSKTGGLVALKVLKIHEFVIKSIHGNENVGANKKKSYYLNKKSRNKIDNSERIDIEFYGKFGVSDVSNPITRYIKMYRKYKSWIRNSTN